MLITKYFPDVRKLFFQNKSVDNTQQDEKILYRKVGSKTSYSTKSSEYLTRS